MVDLSPYIFLAGMLLLAGIAVFVVLAALIADALIRPPRMTDGKALHRYDRVTPGDIDLPFENVQFDIVDESLPHGRLMIVGWWIAASEPSNRCVILVHGYADGKIGSIAWAPLWRAAGYHVLAIDQRAHGESGGRFCTAGVYERFDLSQIIDDVRTSRPAETSQLVLFGASMGAGVVSATAGMRDDLAGIVLDSPYLRFLDAARIASDRLGLPDGRCFGLGTMFAQRRAKARFDTVDPLRTLPHVKCPIFCVHAGQDVLAPGDAADRLNEAIRSRGNPNDRIWTVESAEHLKGIATAPEQYAARLKAFLSEAYATSLPGESCRNRSSASSVASHQTTAKTGDR